MVYVKQIVGCVGDALNRKALFYERLCDPLTYEEFVFDEQDADWFAAPRIYPCVHVHDSHPPVP